MATGIFAPSNQLLPHLQKFLATRRKNVLANDCFFRFVIGIIIVVVVVVVVYPPLIFVYDVTQIPTADQTRTAKISAARG